MSYLLIPGRHLVNTAFQESYMLQVMKKPIADLKFLHAGAAELAGPLTTIVFVITSSNQQNSRYNPIEFHIRAIGVDRFGRRLAELLGINYRIVGIPHFGKTQRFARHTIKEILEQTEGQLELTPTNTVMLGSTPSVIAQYHELGYAVLPAELQEVKGQSDRDESAVFLTSTPIQLVQHAAKVGADWIDDLHLKQHLHPQTRSLWIDFPEVPARIVRLYRDPLLNDQGSITETRDYGVYAWAMSNPAAIEFKYRDIEESIVPGKIVDEGCADAALLVPVARDFNDSDLIGIEITGEFMAQCRERQRRGDFGGTFTHFHQRNLMEDIFEPDSIDTTICNSTVHELWSYGQQSQTLKAYLTRKFAQTRRNGRIIVRDVVSPELSDSQVYLWLDGQDGSNAEPLRDFADPADLRAHLDGLSTRGRFIRFARDFLREMITKGNRQPWCAATYSVEQIDGQDYFVTTLKVAAEFLAKKDYTDSWNSEMNEEFTYWSFSQWKTELQQAGFSVLPSSRAYINSWIVENRLVGRAKLFKQVNGQLLLMDWPVTNLVIIGEKK